MPDSTEEIQTEDVEPMALRLGTVEEELGTLRGKLWAANQKIERLENLLKIKREELAEKQKQLDCMTEAAEQHCEMIDQLRERFPVDDHYQSRN